MKKINIVDDLVNINNLSADALDKLVYMVDCIIADTICESLIDFNKNFEFDIGIGKLYISIESRKSTTSKKCNSVRYKFIPSDDLENSINNVLKGKRSPLTVAIEKSLQKKVFNTYKDLM